jgi:hypothetical protein
MPTTFVCSNPHCHSSRFLVAYTRHGHCVIDASGDWEEISFSGGLLYLDIDGAAEPVVCAECHQEAAPRVA